MSDLYTSAYNPDVLSCLANLSNDEVFTPPHIVNQMLDMLPQELFRDKNTKFLDPATKSGVFLREIAKRLLEGLKEEIPDLQERIDHIFQNQLYGIALTEMTSLLSRRSVYCTKYPNSKYSISLFNNSEGNIRFKRLEHKWSNKKCVICGANKEEYERNNDLENYAYEFIHNTRIEEIYKMKFDVIIGNPPYQLTIGVEKENYAIPIYQKFVENAKKLKPRYISMIIPARWYAGGRGLDDFRNSMLNDTRLRKLHDFSDASECFPGVQIKGGVCYFLWDRDNTGDCEVITHSKGQIISTMKRPLLEKGLDTFIRHNEAISILHKVQKFKFKSFSTIVSPQTPFGIISSFKDYSPSNFHNSVKFYTNNDVGYIDKSKIKNRINWIEDYKVYISAAYGAGEGYPHQIINKPFIGEPNSCCSQTYLLIGPFQTQKIGINTISYMKTKFFRFLVMLKKNAQHAMRGVYEIVPLLDLNKEWTDNELYRMYGLSENEIKLIEEMIKPMDI